MNLKKNLSNLAFLSLCTLSIPATAQTKNNFTINGVIKNMPVLPAKVYLYAEQKLRDSAKVVNGTYHFSGNIAEVNLGIITSEIFSKTSNYDFVSFLVDKGVTNVSSAGTLANAAFSGPAAKATLDYKEAIKETTKVADSLKKIGETDEFKTNAALRSAVQIKASNLVKPMTEQMIAYLKKHPATPASPVFMGVIASSPFSSAALADSLLHTLPAAQQLIVKNKMNAELEKKKTEELAKEQNEKKTSLGSIANDFTLNDVDGKPVSLSSFKGKYVLVDFWASWCGPCRAENPNVVATYQQYKDKGFTILGVSLDGASGKSAWLAAIKKDGLNWTQVSDLKGWDNEAAKLYGVQAIPQNFLIDPQGVIVAKNLRGEELQKKIASLFN